MHIDPIEMTIRSKDGVQRRRIAIGSAAGARYALRDVAAMRRTLDDMLARGLAGTKTNPAICRFGRYLLTQSGVIEVQGPLTGGEGEVVAIRDGEEILISVGGDQSDRELDPVFPDKPKQMCPHPIATVGWPYAEVRGHWDDLRIYSHVVAGGHTVTLQDGPISSLVDLEFLLAMDAVRAAPDPMFLYCGAAPFLDSVGETVGGLRLPEETAEGVGEAFFVRLHDPVLGRTIEHGYRVVPLGDDLAERR